MRLVIVDYGMGNIKSISSALRYLGVEEVVLSADFEKDGLPLIATQFGVNEAEFNSWNDAGRSLVRTVTVEHIDRLGQSDYPAQSRERLARVIDTVRSKSKKVVDG